MKPEKKSLIENSTFIKIAAIIIAFFCWLFVASAGNTVRNSSVSNIPIDISLQERILSELDLNVIDISQTEVTANIKGERVAVGKIQPADIAATVKFPSNIDASIENEFELPLVPLSSNGNRNPNYEVVSYTPSHIKIRLDSIESKTLPIDVDIKGDIVIAEGFIQQRSAIATPESVVISGPKQEVDKVSKAVVNFELADELSSSYIEDYPITLMDSDDKIIDLSDKHLKINEDTARVVIPIAKERTLPLTIDFVDIPRNFPTEKLNDYQLSNKNIKLAGNPDAIDKYNEIVLGYIDVHQLSKEKNKFTFDIDLPENFVNLDNLQTATVTFNTSNWSETLLDVSDIKLSNPPDGYNVELITTTIPNVLIVGETDIINSISSDDIIAEVNFAEKKEISVGQYQYPVSISVPAKDGLIWASGEYSIVVKVTENETYE